MVSHTHSQPTFPLHHASLTFLFNFTIEEKIRQLEQKVELEVAERVKTSEAMEKWRVSCQDLQEKVSKEQGSRTQLMVSLNCAKAQLQTES